MTAPEIINYATLATPPAWIGYDKTAFARGDLVINICAECEGHELAEWQARKLKCATFRTLCARHLAERTAKRLGETL